MLLFKAEATHIVGGVINYKYIQQGQYEITLKIYRDCINPLNAPFDSLAFISVFNGTTSYLYTTILENPEITTLPLNQPDPCVGLPKDVCVQQAIYKSTLSLPPNDKGYTLMYQRCCRNATIRNISDPLTVGATYSAFIPDSNSVKINSNPVFISLPPVFLCNNVPFSYNHAATDIDGDSLAYKFCSPTVGGDTTNSGAKPYYADPFVTDVPWTGGFGASYPIPSNPSLVLNAYTGKLTGTPTALGQYVVGVCVEEYRNGKLVGFSKRDFQFNVVNCPPKPTAVLPSRIKHCGFDVSFTNNSINASKYDWDFGVATDNSDKSNLFQPSFTYPGVGTYTVQLIINNETICADTAITIVDVYNKVVGTNFDIKDVCLNESVVTNDLSILNEGTVQKRKWSIMPDGVIQYDQPSTTFLATIAGSKKLKLVVENEYGCTDSLEKDIQIFPLPTVDIVGDPFICINETKNYEVKGNFSTLQWKNNPALSCLNCNPTTIKGTTPQKFYVSVTGANNCSNTDSVEISIPSITATVTPNSTICYDNDFQLYASGGLSYKWFPATNLSCTDCSNPKVKIKTNSVFNVEISDQYKCKDTASINLTVRPKTQSNIAPITPKCFGKSAQITLTAPQTQYVEWSPSSLLSCNNCYNPTTQSLYKSQLFYAVLTDNNSCTLTDSVLVQIYDRQIDLGDSAEICYGDSISVNLGNVNVLGWTPPELCQNCSKQSLKPKDYTQYKAFVLDQNNCTYSDTLNVRVRKQFPIFDFEINNGRCYDNPVFLKSQISNIDPVCFTKIYYNWEFGDGSKDSSSHPIHYYTSEGTKTITLQLKNVPDTLSKEITLAHPDSCLKNIYIPNAFTPNNDGQNDILYVRGINIRKVEFHLYNNLGERVFHASNLHTGWDGIFKGEKQTSQVFVYHCDATFWDGSTTHKEGNVTLIE